MRGYRATARPTAQDLQPDLVQSGGITGVKVIADLAASYRMPICLHNVSGLLLNLASQQFTAAIHNAPRMECARGANRSPAGPGRAPVGIDLPVFACVYRAAGGSLSVGMPAM